MSDLTAIIATYENEHIFRDDEDAWGEYQAYLSEHDAYRIRGGVLCADDFVEWLNWSCIGQRQRDRVLSEVDSGTFDGSFPTLKEEL